MPEDTHRFVVPITNPETNEVKSVPIIRHVPSKGRGKDNPKYQPENFDSMTLEEILAIWGSGKIGKLVKSKLRQMFAAFTAEATSKTIVGPDGKETEAVETDLEVIQKDFSDMISVLSQRGETLQSLSRRLNEIYETELPDVVDRLFSGGTDLSSEEFAKLKELAKSLKEEAAEIKLSIESKKKKKPEQDEQEEAQAA